MTTLVEHARRELELSGQTAEDPSYAASIVAAAVQPSASGPTAAIVEPTTATDPVRWIVYSPSIVRIVALVILMSQDVIRSAPRPLEKVVGV